jgi:hypothetical protein
MTFDDLRSLVAKTDALANAAEAAGTMVLVAKDGAARQLHPDDFASDLTRILRQLS